MPKFLRTNAFLSILWITHCSNPATTSDLLDAKGILADITAPAILSPAPSGGGRATDLKAKLLWATKIPAKYYEVELTSDANYQTPVAGSPFRVTAPTTELEVTLPDAVRYYWRVRTNYNAPGIWSTGFFDAMNANVYVYCASTETACSDTGQAGNKSHPFRTISAALAYARTAIVSDILVARRGGTSAYQEPLVLISGVNLRGGYTATFLETEKDMSYGNQTRVAIPGTLLFALNITGATTVEGFQLTATDSASAIGLVSGSNNNLIVQYNRLETSVNQPGPSYGLLVQNSGTTHTNGPIIRHNAILSGNVTTPSSITAGVRLENSALQMRNNYIKSGTIVNGIANFPSLASGLLVVNSNPLAVNNVIISNSVTSGSDAWSIGTYHFPGAGGTYTNNTIATLWTSGNTYAVALNGGTGMPLFTNNIFFNAGGGRVFYEWNTTDNPVSLHNNAYVGGGFFYRDNGTSDRTDGDVNNANNTNQGTAATVSGNLRTAVGCAPFVNYGGDDWRLQQNSCTANEWRDLRYGGRNTNLSNCGTGSASCGSVTDDLNATSRTAVNTGSSPLANAAGYSMGAYESD